MKKDQPLKIIKFSFCNLTSQSLSKFKELFKKCSQTLNYIDLSFNDFGFQNSDQIFLEELYKLENVKEFNFAGCKMNFIHGDDIKFFLQKHSSIEIFDISENEQSEFFFLSLLCYISEKPSLRTLGICGISNVKSVFVERLSVNPKSYLLEKMKAQLDIEEINKMKFNLKNVDKLILSKMNFYYESNFYCFRYCIKRFSIKKLILKQCYQIPYFIIHNLHKIHVIDSEINGIEITGNCLKVCSLINTTLSIRSDAKSLLEVVRFNSFRLKKMKLSFFNSYEINFKTIISNLSAQINHVETIHFSKRDVQFKQMVEMLYAFKNLRRIDLSGTNLSQQQIIALAEKIPGTVMLTLNKVEQDLQMYQKLKSFQLHCIQSDNKTYLLRKSREIL